MKNNSVNNERAQAAMQQARQMIRQEWLDAGVTEKELDEDDAVMCLLSNLIRAGHSMDTLLAEWQTKTNAEILREYAAPTTEVSTVQLSSQSEKQAA